MKYSRQYQFVKVSVLVVLASVFTVGCRPSATTPSNSSDNDTAFHTSPPFATKEPDRYQARRIVTLTESTADNSVNKTQTSSVLIVRDGNKRREEYEGGAPGSLVFLENETGRFIMLPQAKLYADANEPGTSTHVGQLQVEAELASPDLLLHESNIASQYQKLGTEVIAGRTATKYNVINSQSSNTETFIWVDDSLGMPIASQSTSTSGTSSTRVSMELQDIRTELDPGLFSLPADYHKVAAAQIFAMIRGTGSEVDLPRPQK